jgi:hypothetical protein
MSVGRSIRATFFHGQALLRSARRLARSLRTLLPLRTLAAFQFIQALLDDFEQLQNLTYRLLVGQLARCPHGHDAF